MARGYIYEMATDINTVGSFTESDLNGTSFIGGEVDFISPVEDDKQEALRDDLRGRLIASGADVKEVENTEGLQLDWGADKIISFQITQRVKNNWFRKRYESLVNQVNKLLCLRDFATDSIKLGNLRSTIEDRYGDLVYLEDEGWATFDQFMRSADPETTYYIGNVILCH